MIQAQILSFWTTNILNEKIPYFVNLGVGDNWVDATQEDPVPGVPNSVVLDTFLAAETFAIVSVDPDLFILWDIPNPRNPDSVPSTADFGLLRAYLAKLKWTQMQINAAIGLTPNGRNWRTIANNIIGYLR